MSARLLIRVPAGTMTTEVREILAIHRETLLAFCEVFPDTRLTLLPADPQEEEA